MTDEEWERIKPLAEAEATARLALESWGMRATPNDPRQRIEAMMQRQRLQHEWDAAQKQLREALQTLA